jgi:hypothetical protein
MRALALSLALGLSLSVSGCGFLFTTIVHATRGPPGPLTESQRVSGRTSGGFSRHAISCGAASGSPQNDHGFVAPAAGTYTFDSITSDYDGVIAVYDANGMELACNDDHGSTRASEVAVVLSAGQTVTVVQGGYAGGAGSYEMWVTGVAGSGATGSLTLADGTVVPVTPAAPPQELPLGASVMGDTSGLGAIGGVTCPPTSPMQEWRFTAPSDGSFLFQVDSGYDAYLGIIDDLGTSLGCNDDYQSTTHARVALDLAQGTTVRVIVGGYASQSGAYSLAAVQVSTGGAITLGQPLLFSAGATSSEPDVCGAPQGSVDRTFTFTPRAEAFYALTADVTATLVLSDGRRTAMCIPLSPDRRAGFVLKAGHRYTFVLELGYSDGQAHTLQLDRVDPAAPDWQVPPQAPPIGAFTPAPVPTTTTAP